MRQSFQDKLEQIDVPKEDVRLAIRQGAEQAKLTTNNKRHLFRNVAVAAALFVITMGSLSFSFPALAERVPAIESFFTYLFDDYTKSSTGLGITQESNGIRLTLTESTYDGENVVTAFTMSSDIDLGEEPILQLFPDINNGGRGGGTQLIEKVGEHEYKGLLFDFLYDGLKPDTLQMKLKGYEIHSQDMETRVEGNWEFEWTLDTIGSESKEFERLVSSAEGFETELTHINSSSVATSLYFTQRIDTSLKEFEDPNRWYALYRYDMSDNLGNEYTVVGNDGWGDSQYFLESRAMTTTIAEDATSLIITPIVSLYKDKEKEDLLSFVNELEPVKDPFTLPPIVVPLD